MTVRKVYLNLKKAILLLHLQLSFKTTLENNKHLNRVTEYKYYNILK